MCNKIDILTQPDTVCQLMKERREKTHTRRLYMLTQDHTKSNGNCLCYRSLTHDSFTQQIAINLCGVLEIRTDEVERIE